MQLMAPRKAVGISPRLPVALVSTSTRHIQVTTDAAMAEVTGGEKDRMTDGQHRHILQWKQGHMYMR